MRNKNRRCQGNTIVGLEKRADWWEEREIGNRKSEVGLRKWDFGSGKSEVGLRKWEIGSGNWEGGSGKSEIGSGK